MRHQQQQPKSGVTLLLNGKGVVTETAFKNTVRKSRERKQPGSMSRTRGALSLDKLSEELAGGEYSQMDKAACRSAHRARSEE